MSIYNKRRLAAILTAVAVIITAVFSLSNLNSSNVSASYEAHETLRLGETRNYVDKSYTGPARRTWTIGNESILQMTTSANNLVGFGVRAVSTGSTYITCKTYYTKYITAMDVMGNLIVKPVEMFDYTMIYIKVENADLNGDGKFNIRDAAYIAVNLAKGKKLPVSADYNGDGKVDIRDAVAIAKALTGIW